MNIVVFGSGMVARKLLSYPLKKEHKILYICDNNKDAWGKELYGNKITPPPIKNSDEIDILIVALVRGWMDVFQQLLDIGIPRNKIIHAVDWSKLDYFPCPELEAVFDIQKKPFDPFVKKTGKILRTLWRRNGKSP